MTNDRGFQSILRPGRGDDEDELLEALAAKKGISRLQSPHDAAPVASPPRPRAEPSVPAAPRPAVTAVPEPGPGPKPEPGPGPGGSQGPTPRSRSRSMNLELPDYVMRALKEMALREDCSVRHLIMRALARDGIPIAPADMIADGRRLRGKNAHA